MATHWIDVLMDPVIGSMAQYKFLSIWRLAAPIEAVWEEIRDFERWPTWWRGVRSARRTGEGTGRLVWAAPMGYEVATDFRETLVEPPRQYAGLSTGDLSGTGTWTLSSEGALTTVRYDFAVRTTKWWVKLLSPVARPFFIWNHDQLMKQGGEGLARHLGVSILH